MTIRPKPRITELGGLLSALNTDYYGSRKTLGEVKLTMAGTYEVHEHFDSGSSSSGAFTSDVSDLDAPIFEEAMKRMFISAKPELGYMSKYDFRLTRSEYLLEEIYPIIHAWERKEWLLARSKNLLDEIPIDARGTHFHRACENELEYSFAILGAQLCAPAKGPPFLMSILSPPEDTFGDTNLSQTKPPEPGREWAVAKLVAATLIQWLGTTRGMEAYEAVVKRAHGEITIKLPS